MNKSSQLCCLRMYLMRWPLLSRTATCAEMVKISSARPASSSLASAGAQAWNCLHKTCS